MKLFAFRAVLILNSAFSLATVLIPTIYSWAMFSNVQRTQVSATDRQGQPLQLEDYVTKGTYFLSSTQLVMLGRFICRTDPNRAPLSITEKNSGFTVTITKEDCEAR